MHPLTSIVGRNKYYILSYLFIIVISGVRWQKTTYRSAKRLGIYFRYNEGSLYQTYPYHKFLEKLPKCPLYRGIVNVGLQTQAFPAPKKFL